MRAKQSEEGSILKTEGTLIGYTVIPPDMENGG